MIANPILTDLQANRKSIDWNLGRIIGVPRRNVLILKEKSKKSDFFAWGSQIITAIHEGRFTVGYPAMGNIPPIEWPSPLIPVAQIATPSQFTPSFGPCFPSELPRQRATTTDGLDKIGTGVALGEAARRLLKHLAHELHSRGVLSSFRRSC
jgi:hypothetical protein